MIMKSAIRYGAAALALGAASLLTLTAESGPAVGQSNLVQDGKISFVVSRFGYALPASDDVSAMCPNGLSIGPTDIFAASPEGQRHEGESDADYTARLRVGTNAILTAPNGQNLCANPEAGAPDPHHPFLTGDVPADGIDLDGQVSRVNGRPALGTCAHDDFQGLNGVRGVDNQFMRAVGCTNTVSPGGQQREFDTGMLVGEWGILITLEDVQDLRNDNNVVVRFYANNDPIQLSPTREALPNATYAAIQDPRYQASTRGRIVNGVLTTEPVDTRFIYVVASIYLDRVLRDTRLRLTIGPDGAMEGIMAGYAPVEDMYDVSFGFRNGRGPNGQPTRYGSGAASGYARTARHTCNGVYYAMHQMADGHRDPATGRCTSISTQYRLKAIPAFVVHSATQSVNQDLEAISSRRAYGQGQNQGQGDQNRGD